VPRKPQKPRPRHFDEKAYFAQWRADNREKCRGYAKAWRERHLDVARAKARHFAAKRRKAFPDEARQKSKLMRDKLCDAYVARNVMGVPTRECPREIIELVRSYLVLKRETKNL
jgi:hypothetical protein